MSYQILHGDVLERLRLLPDNHVHCVVTSPPYWGLRDYGMPGQIGLEKTPEEFIAKLVEVFREVRRVLRPEGTCWVNMGDAYSSHPNQRTLEHGATAGEKQNSNKGSIGTGSRAVCGLKPKDLIGQPWMLAFALRADGWWLRQDIIWSKPNPMPESVTDRCTKAHEYLFLLTKSARYFYDAEAIKEGVSGNAHLRGGGVNPKATREGMNSRMRVDRDPAHAPYPKSKQNESFSAAITDLVTSRNKRSVWEIATEAFPEAHFATFPTKLVEPCILAGTSEKGCCSACGAPWVREVAPSEEYEAFKASERERKGKGNGHGGGMRSNNIAALGLTAGTSNKSVCAEVRTVGWKSTCDCDAPLKPCVVLDPFNGAGTTGLVAVRMGREYIGIELNPEYVAMTAKRLREDRPLFAPAESAVLPEPEQMGLEGVST